MTALCGGGASQSIPGFNSTVVITAAAVEGLLVLSGLEIVAAILGPIIAPTVLELTSFCATDPPADPGLTGADIIAATNWTDPLAAIAAQEKIRQWFMSRYWYQVCECASVATPSPPSLSNPGPISTNPGLPTAPSGATCWDGSQIWPNNPPFQIIQDNVLLWADGESLHNNTGTRTLMSPLPSQIQLTGTYDHGGAFPGDNVFIQIDWFDSAGHVIRTDKTGILDSPPKMLSRTLLVAPPAGSVTVQFGSGVTGAPSGGPTGAITMRVVVWCGGSSPSTPNSPCCPPDPTVELKLDAIMGLLTSVFQSIPSPINSYADATTHTGLTGNGTLTLVDSPLAVTVNITTDNATLGVDSGDPNFLFNRGYIVPIVNSAPIRREVRLVYNPQMYELPALTEQLGYSLHPGITVAITELVRGP